MVEFYWDSYFINLSLIRGGKIDLAKGMVENCFYLIERHGFVIANRKRWAAGSQLPFLSQMVRDIFNVTADRRWLATAVQFVQAEYERYWLSISHLAYNGLSRYIMRQVATRRKTSVRLPSITRLRGTFFPLRKRRANIVQTARSI